MIPQTAEYALRAVGYLMQHSDRAVQRAEIASKAQISPDYLHKILQKLDKSGLVTAQRGPGGGYRLKASPVTLTVWDVFSVVAEVPRITSCPLGLKGHEQLCPLHRMLDEQARQLEEALKKTLMTDLVPEMMGDGACRFPQIKQ